MLQLTYGLAYCGTLKGTLCVLLFAYFLVGQYEYSAAAQGSKTGHAVCVGGAAYSFSSVSHSYTNLPWASVSSNMRKVANGAFQQPCCTASWRSIVKRWPAGCTCLRGSMWKPSHSLVGSCCLMGRAGSWVGISPDWIKEKKGVKKSLVWLNNNSSSVIFIIFYYRSPPSCFHWFITPKL